MTDAAVLEKARNTEQPAKKPGIRVRLSEQRDVLKAKEILRRQLANSIFKDVPFSDRKADRQMASALARSPRSMAITAEWQGECAGFAWAVASPFILSDGPLMVTVHIISVDLELAPARRARVFLSLVAAIRQWAGSLNASHTFIHVTTGANVKSTDHLMRAAGAKILGGAYVL